MLFTRRGAAYCHRNEVFLFGNKVPVSAPPNKVSVLPWHVHEPHWQLWNQWARQDSLEKHTHLHNFQRHPSIFAKITATGVLVRPVVRTVHGGCPRAVPDSDFSLLIQPKLGLERWISMSTQWTQCLFSLICTVWCVTSSPAVTLV